MSGISLVAYYWNDTIILVGLSMEDDFDDNQRPECPNCNDSNGDCQHVVLNYDATSMEFLSGYLADDKSEIDKLEQEILALLKSKIRPKLKKGYLKEFWNYALENHKADNNYIEFDITSYFKLMYEEISAFDGDAFKYDGEDWQPGQSSVYIIFFARDACKVVQQFNEFIIDQLKR